MAKFKWLLPKCENPRCPQQRGVWRSLLDPPQGVLLHKQWLCSPGCLDQMLEESLSRLMQSARANRGAKAHRFPLGLLMLSLGLINSESLQSALHAQREAGKGRVGDWLRKQGAVTEPQVTQALAAQWSLPVYPLEKFDGNLSSARLVPFGLLDTFRMLPVHCAPAMGMLHVAFSSRVDYTALYAIEQMLEFHTEPCVAQESYIDKALERLHRESWSTDTPIAGPIEPSIISGATVQHAMMFGAQEVRVVGCADEIWVRLHVPDGARDLLFRPAPNSSILTVEHSKLTANFFEQERL
jgi:hypothetical protein